MISDKSISLVMEIPPAQVIEHYTHQQPRRGRYLCPFHNDHNPSMTVKGKHWQCWSCNKGGDVINFVRDLYGLTFPEAVCKLADDFNIALPESATPADPLEKLWRIVEEQCRDHNRRELVTYRERIDQEILNMTAAHRALLHYGASDEILQHYGNEIDDLIAYRNTL